MQVVNFTGLLQFVNKLQQACQFHQVATSLLKSGLLQLVICRLVTTCWNLQQACWNNQLATSLLTTCNRLVVRSGRKPCERILITACCNKLLQDVNRLVATCAFLAMYYMYENVSYILLNIHSMYYTFCIIYDIYRVQKTQCPRFKWEYCKEFNKQIYTFRLDLF